jgi:hydroxycarboxylate dehydrogenase B
LIVRKEALIRAIDAVVAAGGSEPREAKLVAENLVMANLLGHDSHGVGMIPRYIDALLEGGLAANQHPKATVDTGALLALDGCKGYGQSIGFEAMQMAIERAKRHGACVMTVANSHHLGRIGHWAEMAVAEGLVSIHFVNVISHARVAPYAGMDARFGTNPVCIGIPLPGEAPFLLDMATSAVAQGKMRVAHNKREKVKPGLLIDDKGNPTEDPRYAVVPPLGAILAYEESSKQRVLNGMLALVIDPERLGNAAPFASESRQFVDWLRKGRVAPGHDKVRIAGEPEREVRAQREKDGIPVDDNTWQEIIAAGAKVKVPRPALEKLAGV